MRLQQAWDNAAEDTAGPHSGIPSCAAEGEGMAELPPVKESLSKPEVGVGVGVGAGAGARAHAHAHAQTT